ncbi:PH domain-containing protein [Pseudidiomarina gelatinasegens]|uniref:PH domain-containing protein n=1 Tax=Pseudidiomarina gelatinasegens TaxID=2487740 RepID=UPI003A976369
MTELTWQRTSLLTLGFFVAKEIRQFVRNITNFIPVLAVIFVTDNDWLPYAVGGGYLVFIVISAILNHHFFLYALTDDAVHLRTGVFGKKSLTLKYERIQQAELDQTWYFRPFNLTILRVDSAGSAGKEVEIPGLPIALAQDLRQRMLAQAATTNHSTDSESNTGSVDESAQHIDLQRNYSLREIVRAGIMDNKIFVLLAVLIYPLSQTDVLEEQLVPWLEANVKFIEQSLWLNVGLVVTALVVLFTLAIGVTIASYYNLQFTIANQRYQARSGLLSIRTVSFRYHKLQRVRIKQNLRGRLLGRFSARVSQLQPSAHAQQQGSAGAFVLPVLTQAGVDELCHWLQLPDRSTVPWQRISSIALLNPSFWVALVAPAVAVVGYFKWQPPLLGLVIGALVWVLLQAYTVARWQNYGYVMTEGWLGIKRGVFGRIESWYPLYKTQQIDVYQSPWLRLLGYADVVVHTAAGAQVIKYQPAEVAFNLQREWTATIANNRQRWM